MEVREGDDDSLIPVYPTYEDLERHLGLKVTTNRIERQTWMKHMARRIENAVLKTIEQGDAK